jgi:hypothetical protein
MNEWFHKRTQRSTVTGMTVFGKSFGQVLHAVILHCERIGTDASKYEYMLNFQALPTRSDQSSPRNMRLDDQRTADLARDPSQFPETPRRFS